MIELGKRYRDTDGRKWKVIKCYGFGPELLFMVKRGLATELAVAIKENLETLMLIHSNDSVFREAKE